MTAHRTRPSLTARRTPLVAAALLLGAALGLGGPLAPALAHDPVTTTVPAEGAALTEPPAAFSVTTAQPMLDLSGDGSGFGIQVTDAAGLFYGDGCLTVADATMSMPATLGAAGAYTMVFQYVSSDGHTTSGTIAFTYAPTDAAAASPGSPTPPQCGVPVETPSAAPSVEPSADPEPSALPTQDDAGAVDEGAGEASAALAIVGGIAAALGLAAVIVAIIARRGRNGSQRDGSEPDAD